MSSLTYALDPDGGKAVLWRSYYANFTFDAQETGKIVGNGDGATTGIIAVTLPIAAVGLKFSFSSWQAIRATQWRAGRPLPYDLLAGRGPWMTDMIEDLIRSNRSCRRFLQKERSRRVP